MNSYSYRISQYAPTLICLTFKNSVSENVHYADKVICY